MFHARFLFTRGTDDFRSTLKKNSIRDVMHALRDSVRIEIVFQLTAADGEVPCRCFGFDMPKLSLSHHFKVLREAGIVATRREGKEWVNSICKEDMEA